jgi:chromate reductase
LNTAIVLGQSGPIDDARASITHKMLRARPANPQQEDQNQVPVDRYVRMNNLVASRNKATATMCLPISAPVISSTIRTGRLGKPTLQGHDMAFGTDARVKLLGLSGSLRTNSYCRSVLHALQRALAPEVHLAIRNLRLPLYNEDEDGDVASEVVRNFRSSIAECGGLVIVTPEYNHGIPGVLKNALDWASRPLNGSVLAEKPVVVISASPAFTGGVRAQASVHDTLLAVGARIIDGPQIVIGNVAEKVVHGEFVDKASLAFALNRICRMVKNIRRSKSEPPLEIAVAASPAMPV